MMDVVFNVVVLAIDGLLLRQVRKSPRPIAAFALGAGGLLCTVLVAALLQKGMFHWLRLCAYVVFVHMPFVLGGYAWIFRGRSMRVAMLSTSVALLVAGVGIHAFFVEPYRIEVMRLQIPTAKVSSPIRVAVVADLQADRITSYEEEALALVLEQKPDLVLMPGDFLQTDSASMDSLATDFRLLLDRLDYRAPLGIFATRGNTEHDDWPELFSTSRVTVLKKTTHVRLGEIDLTGLDLWSSFDPDLQIQGTDRFHIVFGHAPDFALGEIDADLLIAGHTHGGQVRLPFLGPILTFSKVPRSWAAGSTRLDGGRTLVVSRGIGMERGDAPRLRFLCRPQIVIIDVVPNASRMQGSDQPSASP